MIDTLMKRKSVRTYTGESITEEELNIILKACDASPVGMKQYDSLHLTIISNKEVIEKIEEAASKRFSRPGSRPLYGAPTLIIISSKKLMPGMDNVMYSNAAIMSHNISLAATSLGIGSCYIWGATACISTDEEVLKLLKIPEGYTPCCAVTLGKTEEKFEEREIPERITRNFIK